MSRVGRNSPLAWPDPTELGWEAAPVRVGGVGGVGGNQESSEAPDSSSEAAQERRVVQRRFSADSFEAARRDAVVLSPSRPPPLDWTQLARYLDGTGGQPSPLADDAPALEAEPRRSRLRGFVEWVKELLGGISSARVRRDDGVQPVLAREQLRYVPTAARVYASPDFLRRPYAETYEVSGARPDTFAAKYGPNAFNATSAPFHFPVASEPISYADASDAAPAGTLRASSFLYANVKA